jgi:adenylate cyclase
MATDPERGERRRLVAILAADVVGYSRLIAEDEADTLARLRALFQEVVRPAVAARGGRVFRLLGDCVLAEFPSAVEALRCALRLQDAVASRAANGPVERLILLRIGLDLGDVVVERGDLFGDGVNVAARLEALAEPGSVVVSAAVRDQARGRLTCDFEDLGPQTLKNIPRPIHAFRLRLGTTGVLTAAPVRPLQAASVSPQHTSALGAQTEAKYLIVVDDEPELGRMIADYLAGHGFAVRTATDGRALDRLLAAGPADLVILDVNMPGEDGFAIARRLHGGDGGPRILFLTAASDVADRVTGLELGAEDYLTKPFDLRELHARIRAILRGRPDTPKLQAASVLPIEPREDSAAPRYSHPSLAVLPFRSFGEEASQELLADGMVEDLIAALSHLHWFFVIARNSSFTYKGRMVPAPQVGRELGVKYVVEGALRCVADRVRITVQLVETESGRPVWADRFDGSRANVFELQDEVVARVVAALEPNLRRAEIARLRRQPPTDVPRAYENYLRALASMHPMTAAKCAAAIELLNQALADDPGFSLALAASAWCRMWRVAQDLTGDITPEARAEMIELSEAALAVAPDNPTVLAQVSLVFSYLAHRRLTAIALAEKAVALHPNSALARAVAGWAQLYAVKPEEAIVHFTEAVRLDALDPSTGEPMAGAALAELLAGRLETAIEWGERAVAVSPHCMTAHRARVAALGVAGHQAAAAVAQMMALAPGFSLAGYATLRQHYAEHPLQRILIDGLRRAGVPELPTQT